MKENKKEIKEARKENKYTIVFILVGSIIFVLSVAAIIISYLTYTSISYSNNINSNVELKYTNRLTTKSDGVYITDVSEVVNEVMPSIVSITSKTIITSGSYGPFSRSYTAEGAGSGVIIKEDDSKIYILTNYHVVEDSKELSVKFINDKSYDATILGSSERKDIAIVYVNKSDIDNETLNSIKIATLGDSDELKVGNGIIAIGNALGYGQSVTTGVVSALNREVSTDDYTQDMIQIDAAINGGNSGGALLNSKGEVVGINSVKYSSNASSSSASIEGMGFAIPISDITSTIEKIMNGEKDTGITLGIEGYMTTSSIMAAYKLPEGFYVSAIVEGSSASSSDLEIGNIITKIDGTTVTGVESIRKVLNKKNIGDKVTLKVKYVSKNEYKEKDITITLK